MALNGAAGHPQACQALTSMLSRNTLNPADITVLFRNYSNSDPPPIDLIRTPQFLGNTCFISLHTYCKLTLVVSEFCFKFSELLVDALFKPGVKLNPEHKPKYVYLLAYAASVCESVNKKGQKKTINKEELKPTMQAIETVHSICNVNKGSSELIADIATLYQCMR